MALIAWLKREGFGAYDSLDDFTGELGRRSTSALGALAAALVARPEELAELGKGNGHGICASIVGDLRVAKGARLAALKAVLLAGAGGQLAKLFAGAFDLSADPRLADADRQYLVASGLKAFVESVPPTTLNLEVLRGAAAAATAVQAGGRAAVQQVLAAFPASHTPVATARHAALGEPLAAELEQRWLELLVKQYRAAKNAPPAAKRLGRAPEWPPVVPGAMAHLLEKAQALAERPAASLPASSSAPAPSGPKQMPALRAHGRAVPEPETFKSDDARVAPAALRSVVTEVAPAPVAPPVAPATLGDSASAPKTGATKAPLAALRFGEQIELVANRGIRALERLIAAFDVRTQLCGRDRALSELETAAARHGSKDVNEPMLDELLDLATRADVPSPWRLAARAVLKHLSPDRFQTLPDLAADPRFR